MNWKKKVAAVLLTALMVAMCCVPTFAVSRTYKTYVVLGDSIAAGYMLDGYQFGGRKKAAWKVTKGSYPAYIRDGVHASKTYQMAHGGYRTSDLRLILDDSYKGDFINGRRLPSKGDTYEVDQEALARLKKDFRKNISAANLITLNIGSNDSTQAFAVLYEMVYNDVDEKTARELSANPLSILGYALADTINLATDSIMTARLAQLELESFTQFRANFDAIIKAIRTLNPNAKLVVMGIYNPVEVASIDTMLTNIQYGQILNPVMDFYNNYMKSGSPYSKQYTYVPMKNIETYIGIGQLDANPDILMDAHPTPKGHKQMADQVLAVL